MTRQVALTCSVCRRKFGGQQTYDRHTYIAGDQYRCRSDEDLRSRGFYRDGWGVWHRGANPDQATLLPLSESVIPTPARALARVGDPETSQKAAEAVAPQTGTLKRVILAIYIDAGPEGLTAFEAAERLGMDPWQVGKRVSELHQTGLIVHCGERVGSNGKDRNVYRAITEAASA